MRGSVAVSIKQRESSPCRTEGREVLAGQYLEVIMMIVQMKPTHASFHDVIAPLANMHCIFKSLCGVCGCGDVWQK